MVCRTGGEEFKKTGYCIIVDHVFRCTRICKQPPIGYFTALKKFKLLSVANHYKVEVSITIQKENRQKAIFAKIFLLLWNLFQKVRSA